MLGNVVNFAPREQIQASPECSLPWCTIPLDMQYIKVKHCLLLNGPIFYLHFPHDNFNDNALPPPLLVSFLFSFPESISSGLISFPVGWLLVFFLQLISCSLFLFCFHHCLQLRVWRIPIRCCRQCHSTLVFLIVTSRCWRLTFLLWFWLDAAKRSHFTTPSGYLCMGSTQYMVVIKYLPTLQR